MDWRCCFITDTIQTMSPDELYHYGIMGMKWGVRRFQNADGSLTAEGKKRYDKDDSPKAKGSKSGGSSKSASTKDDIYWTDERKRNAKIALAITAGVGVAACGAYVARNKWIVRNVDQVLKAGTKFHNLDRAANPRPGEHLYVAYRDADVDFFRGHFGRGKLNSEGKLYDHTLDAIRDVKIPSLKKRQEVFTRLFDSDEEFRNTFKRHSGLPGDNKLPYKAKQVYKVMWANMGDKDDPDFNKAKRKYFDALLKEGYDAIVDEWDTKSMVYRSDAPLILLNTSSKSFGDMTIKELTSRDVIIGHANSKGYHRTTQYLNALGIPHTNHFETNRKALPGAAKRKAKNAEYINKALDMHESEMLNKEQYKNLAEIKIIAEQKGFATYEKSGILTRAGKYLSKNKNMTFEEAYEKAKKVDEWEKMIDAAGQLSAMSMPISVGIYGTYATEAAAYKRTHPNTTMTDAEIRKKFQTGELSIFDIKAKKK